MERWKINLYTLWGSQICSLMGFGFVLPFIPFYIQQMGVTDSVQLSYYVGLSATLPAASMAIAAPIWGIMSDRYGRKMMILRAMLCATLILISMSLVRNVWQFMVLRVLQGIFTGTITASMSFVSANTPQNRMSYSLGLMTSSNFLGFSIGPFVGGMLAEIVGYRMCFVLGGVLMIVGFFLVLFLVKEDKNTYGYKIRSEINDKGEKQKLFNPFVLAIMLCLLVQRIARSVFAPFLALYVQECLGTVVGAARYTGLINGATSLATATAAFTITRRGDKADKLNTAMHLTVISIPIISLAIFFNYLSLFTLFFTIYFFIAGGIEPTLTSAVSERTPVHMRGSLFGVLGTVSSVGAMISPIMGSFVSVKFGLKSILLIIPIFTSIQVICIGIAKRKVPKAALGAKFSSDEKEPVL
ncbi:MAG TPA: MFS transporter [Anaerovoracaceae bacterium]|nr:MFS transporter [Anaerovoracaceae bacterium]